MVRSISGNGDLISITCYSMSSIIFRLLVCKKSYDLLIFVDKFLIF